MRNNNKNKGRCSCTAPGPTKSFSACSPHVLVGFLRFSDFLTKNKPVNLFGYTKLVLDVNVCINGTLQWTGIPTRVYSCIPHTQFSRG